MTTDALPSWEPNWRRRYNSPPDDLISCFYVPAFAHSCKYDRAVGFFSSRLLAEISPSIDEFVANGGRMRLITSPANLTDDDLEAMGPVRISEVETAQKEILSVARRLADSGEIMLGGGGGEEFL